MRVSRIWNDLTKRKRAGFGHDQELARSAPPGSLALFCPACPQPGINLPENWKEEPNAEWKYRRVIIMDGNFKADHIKMGCSQDVYLSDGLGYMVGTQLYEEHLETSSNVIEASPSHTYHLLSHNQMNAQRSHCSNHKAVNQANSIRKSVDITGIGACACKHAFFFPHCVVDFHKGEQ